MASFSPLTDLLMDRSYQLVVVAASRDPVASDTASKVALDMTFTEALPTDALFVVGGGLASVRAAEDAALLDYVRVAASSARPVGSTGMRSLILGSAGPLSGKRATVNWGYRETLESFGSIDWGRVERGE